MGLLEGKKLLVTGVLTDSLDRVPRRPARPGGGRGRSCSRPSAASSAHPGLRQAAARRGARSSSSTSPTPENLAALADAVREHVDRLDGVVHSIGFAPQSVMGGNFLTGDWEDVATRCDVSAFSLKSLAVAAKPLHDRRRRPSSG